MSFDAKVLAHSVNPNGDELLSFELTYPRIVHAELMTHRVFSRNSASTRAIPLKNQLHNLLSNPFIPRRFGVNRPGMQADTHLVGAKHDEAVKVWLRGRDRALTTAIELILGDKVARELLGYDPRRGQHVSGQVLLGEFEAISEALPKTTDSIDLSQTDLLNVHKQLAGRGLEAYMWHTVIVTATEFDNFYALRDHPAAQEEIATIAQMMREVHEASTPRELKHGEWHLPYVLEDEFENQQDGVVASVARCAAVSYNRQNARNFEREVTRHNDLLKLGHMSPFEHQATPFSDEEQQLRTQLQEHCDGAVRWYRRPLEGVTVAAQQMQFSGNLRGFTQYRKQIQHEDNFGLHTTEADAS